MTKIINVPIADQSLYSKDYVVKIRPQGTEEYQLLSTCEAVVRDWYLDQTIADETMSWCSFDSDFADPIEVWVQHCTGANKTVEIRPTAHGIAYEQTEDGVRFCIDRPINLSIEFDGDIYHNLFLYANPLEENVPDKNDPNVLYFEAGVHDIGRTELHSNQTVYFANGAVVYGSLLCEDAENVRVCGRGVLHGKKMNHDVLKPRYHMVRFNRCKNVLVEDLLVLDGPAWHVTAFDSDDVIFRNFKEIGYNANSDGLDVCGCENVLIEGVFLRNHDDSISIKSYGRDNRNIIMRDCVLWNDRAHSMLVGPESDVNKHNVFEDIHFENITVLEHKELDPMFMGVIALMSADNSVFRNISWKHITIERMSYGRLLSMRFTTEYATTFGHGIRDILVEDVQYNGTILHKNVIYGIDSQHTTEDITIKDFVVNGITQKQDSYQFEINQFAHRVTID